MKKLKAGIVGCGAISSVHAQALKGMENAMLTAAADIKLERAQKLAEKYGARSYSSLEEMLQKENLDVLHICTPHALHTPMAKLAAKKGIAVFSEKPPVISYKQLEELKEVSERIPLGICFQNRFNSNVLYTKKLIKALGDFKGARAFLTWHRDEKYYTDSGWRGTAALEGGGTLINQAIHTLDLLTFFLGKPDKVEARTQNFHLKDITEVEDTIEAYISYGSAPVLFYATTSYCTDSEVYIELVFEKATVKLIGERLEIIWQNGDTEKPVLSESGSGTVPIQKTYWGHSHEKCISRFYKELNIKNSSSLANCMVTIELMLAIYSSAQKGHGIDM